MQIVLQAGETSVNVRPYQYPLTAKMREKSVRDLLNTRHIKHNTSPFSSQIIPVKDSTWHMCGLYSPQQSYHSR